MILKPHGKEVYRLIVLGQKQLPEIGARDDSVWGFLDKIGRKPQDVEETAEMLNDLRMKRSQHSTKPLFRGEWR